MVGSWTVSDWLILVIDVVAIAVVVVFLKRKIQQKLNEVEARQAHERVMRKQAARANENGPPTE